MLFSPSKHPRLGLYPKVAEALIPALDRAAVGSLRDGRGAGAGRRDYPGHGDHGWQLRYNPLLLELPNNPGVKGNRR